MIRITPLTLSTIRLSSSDAQHVFRTLRIRGWPTVIYQDPPLHSKDQTQHIYLRPPVGLNR